MMVVPAMLSRASVPRSLVPAAVALAASAWLLVAVAAPASARNADVSKVGPRVGQQVASFTLADQDGRQRTLESLMGSKGVMLVFFRSADW